MKTGAYIFFQLIMLFLMLGGIFQPLVGQKAITIEEAVAIANQHNRAIRSEALKREYAQILTKTSADLPATMIGTENGQFNSAYFDTKISIAQSFNLPVVYNRKKRWLESAVMTSDAGKMLKEKEVRQQLDDVFNEYGYAMAQESLLKTYVDLYQQFTQKTTQRVNLGEADIIEKTVAMQQQAQIEWQLNRVRNSIQLLQIELAWLVNDGDTYKPNVDAWDKQPLNLVVDSSSLSRHPQLLVAYHQWQQSVTFTALQKSMLLPSVNVGFNNASIRGTGADNIVYSASKRFSSFQIGIQIPLFRKSVKASIEAAKADENLQQLNWENEISSLWKQWMTLSENQRLMSERIRFMEQFSLPNAATIKQTASRQLTAGAINYLEFVTLMNQALTIEQEYIQLRREANTIINAIHFIK